jgi:hypothetical protein
MWLQSPNQSSSLYMVRLTEVPSVFAAEKRRQAAALQN